MPIKDLLVVVDGSPAAQPRLEAAVAMARSFSAHLTALCLVAEPFLPALLGAHIPADMLAAQLAQAEREADAHLANASAAAKRSEIRIETVRETAALDRLPTVLAQHARRADLTIIGQPDPDHDDLDTTLLAEAAFMASGRPALVVPLTGARTIPPQRIVIAWDGSREAARAANDALPFLERAQEVFVLVVDANLLHEGLGRHPGAGIAEHLARHGVRTTVKQVGSAGFGISGAIMVHVVDERADLLVMGGYGHSRLREVVLGGTTRHMLERMTLPVLIAH